MTKIKPLELHSFSTLNRSSILKSKQCSCFYCLNIFTPGQIIEWCDTNKEGVGQTALCPFCGVDSVLTDFDVEITSDLLKSMKKCWF